MSYRVLGREGTVYAWFIMIKLYLIIVNVDFRIEAAILTRTSQIIRIRIVLELYRGTSRQL